jgi:hypothetical protein
MRRRMFCELYIYILSYGVVYIYVFGMVLFTYLGLHALYIWDVHGFGFWKNKKRESVLRSETRQGQTGGSNAFVIFGVFNLFA